MKTVIPEFAVCVSKNMGAMTNTVFFPISGVCTRDVTLVKKSVKKKIQIYFTFIVDSLGDKI